MIKYNPSIKQHTVNNLYDKQKSIKCSDMLQAWIKVPFYDTPHVLLTQASGDSLLVSQYHPYLVTPILSGIPDTTFAQSNLIYDKN